MTRPLGFPDSTSSELNRACRRVAGVIVGGEQKGARFMATNLKTSEKLTEVIEESKKTTENLNRAQKNGLEIILENGKPGTVLDLQNFPSQGFVVITDTETEQNLLAVFLGLNTSGDTTFIRFIPVSPADCQYNWNIEKRGLISITLLTKIDTPIHNWFSIIIHEVNESKNAIRNIKSKVKDLALNLNIIK